MRTREIAVAAALGLALAGCGNDFEEKADRICKQGRDDLQEVEKQSAAKPAQQLLRAQRVLRRARADLRRLEPPDDKQDAFDRYLAALDRLVVLEPRVSKAIENGDVGQAGRLAPQVRSADRAAKAAAKEAGLEECAS